MESFRYSILDLLLAFRVALDWRKMLHALGVMAAIFVGLHVSIWFHFDDPTTALIRDGVGIVLGWLVFSFLSVYLLRSAAMELCRDHRASLSEGWSYTRAHVFSMIRAPISLAILTLPSLALLGLWLALLQIPVAGETLYKALAALGIPLYLLVLGWIAIVCLASPIMPAAIAVSGEGSYQSVARSVSYLVRAWPRLLVLLIAKALIIAPLFYLAYEAGDYLQKHRGNWGLPGGLLAFTLCVLGSFVLSASAAMDVVIFLLVRHRVDATPVHQIAMPYESFSASTEMERRLALEEVTLKTRGDY